MAAFAIGAIGGNILKKRQGKMQDIEKLIGIGLLLAGIGVILNLLIKSNFGFSF